MNLLQSGTSFANTNTISLSNAVELAKVFGVTNLLSLIPTNYSGQITVRPLGPEELEDFAERLQASHDGRDPIQHTPTSLKVDGRFNDWRNYSNAWAKLPSEQPGATNSVIASEDSFGLLQCSYCNDSNYLYLFLIMNPSIQSRQDALSLGMQNDGRLRHLGYIVWLYFDRDNDPETGARLKSPELQGTDILVEVSGKSTFYYIGNRSLTFPCTVTYTMYSFESLLGGFRPNGIEMTSMTKTPLIKSGVDGLEIALLLSDIRMNRENKVALVCKEVGKNGRFHRGVIELK